MAGRMRMMAAALAGSALVMGVLVIAPAATATSLGTPITLPLRAIPVVADNSYVYAGINGAILKVDASTNQLLDDSINLFAGGDVIALAVSDDSVYATTNTRLYRASTSGTSPDVDFEVGPRADFRWLAVKQTGGVDDTLYVSSASSIFVLDAQTLTLDDTIPLAKVPNGMALVGDDSLIVTDDSEIRIINTTTTDDSIAATGLTTGKPAGVAVSPDGDWAYVATYASSEYLLKVNTRTGSIVDKAIDSGTSPEAIFVAVAADGTVYVTTRALPGGVRIFDRGILDAYSSVTIAAPFGIAAAPNGRVYVSNATGDPNATGNLRAACPCFLQVIQSSSPAPVPADPPSAPLDVTATAGDGQATVSWKAPASSGSFPITNYLAKASPGGRTCLVAAPALTCTVTGLTNGTAYTFTAEALNGAGWSPRSVPSQAVTPARSASILISGSRSASDPRIAVVKATSTGLVGATATPYVRLPGQTGHSPGTGTRVIGTDGTFTWQRKTGKRVSVYFTSGEVKSNAVVIGAR